MFLCAFDDLVSFLSLRCGCKGNRDPRHKIVSWLNVIAITIFILCCELIKLQSPFSSQCWHHKLCFVYFVYRNPLFDLHITNGSRSRGPHPFRSITPCRLSEKLHRVSELLFLEDELWENNKSHIRRVYFGVYAGSDWLVRGGASPDWCSPRRFMRISPSSRASK